MRATWHGDSNGRPNRAAPRAFGLLTRLTLLGCAFVLSLAGAEWWCRDRVPAYVPPGSYVHDVYPVAACDYLPFSLPANLNFTHHHSEFTCVYATNNAGFRDERPIGDSKPPGERRVLCLGDSFVFGWGVQVDKTFVRAAEAELNGERRSMRTPPLPPLGKGGIGEVSFAGASGSNAHQFLACASGWFGNLPVATAAGFNAAWMDSGAAERFRLLNAGYRDGHTLDTYYAFLVNEADRWSPDATVVAIYLGNDLEDLRHNRWEAVDDKGLPTAISTRRWYRDYRGKYVAADRYDPPLPDWLSAFRLPVLAARALRRRTDAWPAHSMAEAIDRADRLIRGIESRCREKRRPTLWLLIPSAGATPESQYCLQTCKRALNDLGAEYFEAGELLEQSGLSADQTYIPDDFHWTPAAHRLVGMELARRIEALITTNLR